MVAAREKLCSEWIFHVDTTIQRPPGVQLCARLNKSAVLHGRCDTHGGVRLLFCLFAVELGLEDLSPPTALTNLIPIWVRGRRLQSGCTQTTDRTVYFKKPRQI